MRPGCPAERRCAESLASVPVRETQRSLRAGQPVEPGQDARYRLVDVGQHALVAVTGEGRVFQPAAVQPGGEQPHAPFPGDLLVFLAPEREQRAWQAAGSASAAADRAWVSG